jgi:hypothetical protein
MKRLFRRDSNVGQQPVIQLAQVPPLPAPLEPAYSVVNPARQQGSTGRDGSGGPNRLADRI